MPCNACNDRRAAAAPSLPPRHVIPTLYRCRATTEHCRRWRCPRAPPRAQRARTRGLAQPCARRALPARLAAPPPSPRRHAAVRQEGWNEGEGGWSELRYCTTLRIDCANHRCFTRFTCRDLCGGHVRPGRLQVRLRRWGILFGKHAQRCLSTRSACTSCPAGFYGSTSGLGVTSCTGED